MSSQASDTINIFGKRGPDGNQGPLVVIVAGVLFRCCSYDQHCIGFVTNTGRTLTLNSPPLIYGEITSCTGRCQQSMSTWGSLTYVTVPCCQSEMMFRLWTSGRRMVSDFVSEVQAEIGISLLSLRLFILRISVITYLQLLLASNRTDHSIASSSSSTTHALSPSTERNRSVLFEMDTTLFIL